jgi:hypothetical protein
MYVEGCTLSGSSVHFMHIYAGFRVESAEFGVLQRASAAAAAPAAAAAQK